jgi:hypothetical protein
MYSGMFLVDFAAHYINEGELQIDLADNSPGFDYFNVEVNGFKSLVKEKGTVVKLNSGINTIQIQTVDILGNPGTKSVLKINYIPKAR